MAKINLLDKSVFELIAAGEVIERPASVIKELVENAIDAGASQITVEIKDGGRSFMRVTDNGCGIAHEEIPTAFLRHATSKVKTAEDLDRIFTLGFRGEALASVAAVARVEVLTKEAESPIGSSFKISGGEVLEHERTGCPDGTTIIIRDLFYNVPARQKFLKKDVSEGNQVQSLVDKLALAHPEISVRFIRDNKLIRDTAGNSDAYSAVYAVFGKQFAASLIPVDFTLNGVSVSGYTSSPLFGRANRALQYFFVNGRYVRSVICTTALEEGYRNSMMTGKFPACVLSIKLSPELCDVNVSPSKTEVRFAYEKNVFDTVHFAIKNAVLCADNGREIKLTKHEIPAEKPDNRSAERQLSEKTEKALEAVFSKPEAPASEPVKAFEIKEKPVYFHSEIKPVEPKPQESPFVQQRFSEPPTPKKSVPMAGIIAECDDEEQESGGFKYLSSGAFASKPQEIPEKPAVTAEEPEKFRFVGEIFGTYIICEMGEEMLLIDKHAAHERIRFEQRKNQLFTSSQLLAESVFTALTPEQYNAVQENKELLEEAGIEVILTEGCRAEITAAPSALTGVSPEDMLLRAAELLANGNKNIINELYDDLQHSKACKSAIKAHDKNTAEELEALVKEVLADEKIRFCPHGRPVIVKLTKKEIEKYFSRIV